MMKVPFAQRYQILKELERTSCVTTYLCHDGSYGLDVEVDVIEIDKCESIESLERLRQMLDPSLKISSRYAAPLLEWFEEEGCIYLIRESAGGRPVTQVLSETGQLPRQQVVEICRAVTQVLSEAYGRGIFYLGLNPGQLWVDGRGQVKMIRSGYAWIIEELDAKSSVRVSSYRAPETDGAVEGARISDVYSLALMIKEMLPRQDASERLQSLLERCLDPMPSHRPSSPRLLLEELESSDGDRERPPATPSAEETDNYFKFSPLPASIKRSGTFVEPPTKRHSWKVLSLILLGGITVWLLFAAISGVLGHGKDSQLAAVESKKTAVTLPDLEGLPAAEAREVLEKLGLLVELREAPSRLWSVGMVAAQEPAQGSILSEGDLIYLSISSGPDNSPASSSAAGAQTQDSAQADLDSQAAPLPTADPVPTADTQRTTPIAPRAVLSISARRGAAPLHVVLDGSFSHDEDGKIVRYLWDCGDGTVLEGARAQHVFDPLVIPAQFRVSLQVFDNQGLKASTSVTVEVY
ncbi:MAG: hypothetical protein A2W01_00355 [Candidatus Solincola sediminis]|uniref:PASTA domain-containing protein n=1 Tax=Candidatus Solincola sediminis TaxID=1797199 RepID=A0A1F2WHQ9_9ACTN|nr:MAG: hypothetical protein A2Y75_04010 [Candidatus Solincola sediminis]OFW61719.1 MAG: hypothetical protein A2W01_00355 [Candidatus Solincola sediminis]